MIRLWRCNCRKLRVRWRCDTCGFYCDRNGRIWFTGLWPKP